MKLSKLTLYLGLAVAISAPDPASAEDWTTRLGFGGHVSNSPYVGVAPSRLISPIAVFRWQGFTVGTTGVSYRTGGLELTFNSATFDYQLDAQTQLRIGIVSRGAPYASSADPQLAGLVRGGWQEAVLGARYQLTDATELSFDMGRDVTGTVKGGEITFASESQARIGPLPVEAKVGMNWKSAEMSSYLYGVSAAEATGTRPAHTPGASLSPFVSLRTGIPLSKSAAVFTEVRVDALPSNVTASPIVARGLVGSLSLGIGFQF